MDAKNRWQSVAQICAYLLAHRYDSSIKRLRLERTRG